MIGFKLSEKPVLAFLLLCSSPIYAADLEQVAEGKKQESTQPKISSEITADEGKVLMREYLKSLASEQQALGHRLGLELREFSAVQAAKKSEWEARERRARRDFFAKYSDGKTRKSYLKDFKARRSDFIKFLKEETKRRKKDHLLVVEKLKENQKTRLSKFQSHIKNNKRPRLTCGRERASRVSGSALTSVVKKYRSEPLGD